ncbi:winged helix-turn-helix domain-containing protein [Rhizobium sp. LC145]|uniref:winged helix-turn-helix domain-containing protein n=1 Tax=Rhizobium sp. LC145 TaxID=1120688 RepID=UPI000629F07C|nr:winged helix-turn-helix domain-containing protein [Rhizobium sp. LC145]KKX29365.1 chemotaxis protein CheY [Rhizobium sp. LC145]MDX3927893.1 winged helix-turn-helix domain-containing protein [Shinella sp.]TKT68977.1 response regulator [Rhizobiaceae bacterium LC148]
MSARVLLVDDDESLRVVLQKAFETEGFRVSHLMNGAAIEERLRTAGADVLVLSSDLPGLSGLDVCRTVRLDPVLSRLPIVLLVPSGEGQLRLTGLAAGADDCLVKPFSPIEVVVRVKNLLRRMNPALLDHMLKVGDLTLDREAHRVHRQKREVKLGPKEFKLLEFLMRSPGKVYSRSELKASLWGDDATVDERAIDVHIGRLRKGISLGKADKVIRTVRGAGYSLGDF